jgi:hypothetical protein
MAPILISFGPFWKALGTGLERLDLSLDHVIAFVGVSNTT